MKPGIQCVRTHWIPGFMPFRALHLPRRAFPRRAFRAPQLPRAPYAAGTLSRKP
jgi:hypothetical protein